jgi:hypothetical protein
MPAFISTFGTEQNRRCAKDETIVIAENRSLQAGGQLPVNLPKMGRGKDLGLQLTSSPLSQALSATDSVLGQLLCLEYRINGAVEIMVCITQSANKYTF